MTPRCISDALLDGKFHIEPNTRITPEPAPPTSPGDFGVRLTGNPGVPKQIDIDQIFAGFEKARELGMLTREQVLKMKAQILRTHGGLNVATNAAGVSWQCDSNTVKWREANGVITEEQSALSQPDVNDLQRLHGAGGISTDTMYQIRAANRGQPKRNRTGMAHIDRALRQIADRHESCAPARQLAKNIADFWAGKIA